MRFIQLCTFVFIVLVAVSCSDKCENYEYDCAGINSAQLRIVRASDGRDLFFGANRIYDRSRLQFYTLKGQDTSFFANTDTTLFANRFYYTNRVTAQDSTIIISFAPQTETVYMRLSDGDVDTLSLSYQNSKQPCCGTLTSIARLSVNNRYGDVSPTLLVVIKK